MSEAIVPCSSKHATFLVEHCNVIDSYCTLDDLVREVFTIHTYRVYINTEIHSHNTRQITNCVYFIPQTTKSLTQNLLVFCGSKL